MSYLLTVAQIESALGAACQGGGSTPPVDPYVTALGLVQSRLEGMMGVQTLERVTTTDTFTVVDDDAPQTLLRLSNALLVTPQTITFQKDGETFLATPYKIDNRYGIIKAGRMHKGSYQVTYTSGMAADDNHFFLNVPGWLTALAIYCITLWYRTGRITITIPEGIAYGALIEATIREIATRLYESYMRPRAGVIWGEQLTDGL